MQSNIAGMKIAIVGCGALGSFYGAKLCRDGHETHFLLRSDYDAVRRQGVQILSVDGDFHVQPICAKSPEEIGPADLVLIGLKATGNDQLPRLLPPLVGENTSVVTLQNGLGNDDLAAKIVGAEKTLGGICFVALNRIAPGTIRHMGQGMIVLGEFQRPIQERARALEKIISHAAIPCRLTDNLAQARWEKLLWNIPFNGLGVASIYGYNALMGGPLADKRQPCLASDDLMNDPKWNALLRALMDELVESGKALGYTFPNAVADKMFARTVGLGHYKASTLVDFELGRPLELDAMFLEPLRRAQAAGVSVPHMTTLCSVLGEAVKTSRNA